MGPSLRHAQLGNHRIRPLGRHRRLALLQLLASSREYSAEQPTSSTPRQRPTLASAIPAASRTTPRLFAMSEQQAFDGS